MTTTSTLPPARERSRFGLRHLDWLRPPDADEFWPDKLRVRLEGDVRWSDGASYMDYLERIARAGCLKANPTFGKTFRSPVTFGPAISGELVIRHRVGGRADERVGGLAAIGLALNLNPTRTRSLGIRRRPGAGARTVRQFFDPRMTVQEAFREGDFTFPDEVPFDDATNVLLTVQELGGHTPAERKLSRNTFLADYENHLRAFVENLLTPRDLLPLPGDEPEEELAELFHLELKWDELRMERAEMYAERRTPDPVATMQRLSDRSRDFARHVRLRHFSPPKLHFEFEREGAVPQLIVPLTGSENIGLSVYAKTNRRIRFEVQYRKAFSLILKGASRGEDRLCSMILRLASNAADRLPWRELGRAIERPPNVDFARAVELITLISDAASTGAMLGHLLRSLLLNRGVHEDPADPALAKALRKLERKNVIEWVPLQKKESRKGRRYSLTSDYAEVREHMMLGFLPIQPDEFEMFADEVRARSERLED